MQGGGFSSVFGRDRFYKPEEALKGLSKPLRKYYEKNNSLIAQYLYIDRLLDSSLPHHLIDEYSDNAPEGSGSPPHSEENGKSTKIKRTKRNLYRVPTELSPLLEHSHSEEGDAHDRHEPVHDIEAHHVPSHDVSERVITLAIHINFIANVLLLVAKIVVISLTSSMSVLASLVDAVLDFLSTAIIWTTTTLIRRQDRNRYPISRRRLEPLSVLIFAVIIVTSFFQVALSSAKQLLSDDHTVVDLTIPSIAIMGGTVLVKGLCWVWCQSIPNSSVQALAQDAMTDVVFNTFSIIFPLSTFTFPPCVTLFANCFKNTNHPVGTFARIWFLDPLGGLLLSIYIMWNWSSTAAEYIQRLTGAAALPEEHNVLLYMTMRFSRIIQKIQDLKAYYAGDKLNVEVDIVLDEGTSLRDSHDLGESLQYMLESVPTVDRAFVHLDYDPWNLPSHMNQQES
ncbi:hypothetical protein ASPZODRAFT_565988 [Penicilliopsis zonata CBS 506.65]|uniref:Cation efflux protein transmembrane domain-containing protein n=1 Tax=Penicilliopsis zonata CBS 506.65 TaxID=1073090 RepID=A0A1L9SDI1_9EURO|nr:hypothetical protein ASPZODRAFT_565988 [Penicilliopsis zonata CBS 506.65]OJJ45285.1 hypothetical protein ASPZODRAFT_565988 [Penicilliopsis zonata CBS 506.65]